MNIPHYDRTEFSEVNKDTMSGGPFQVSYFCLIGDHILTIFSVGGTKQAYSFVDFNSDGSLLASVGSAPDFMLTVWDWRQEEVMLSCKAISQEVYRVSFSSYNPGLLMSSGSGHIK